MIELILAFLCGFVTCMVMEALETKFNTHREREISHDDSDPDLHP